MTALGILLLELCFGITFEDHALRQNYVLADGQSTPYLDQVAGLEWSASASDEAGPEFAGAIQRCLQRNSAELKSKEGRQKLFIEVVEPLQKCHNSMIL